MKKVTDYLEQEIHIGDFIVWPGRQGSSLWMNNGTVLGIAHGKDWNDREFAKLQVEVNTSNWDGSKKGKRKTTISCVDRVVVIHSVMESKS